MKISNAIEKMKRNYRHMAFYEGMANDTKTSISNVIIDQNKWLRVLQEEQPPIYEVLTEHENAQFYNQNQSWLMGEVEHYIKANKEKSKLIKEKQVESPMQEEEEVEEREVVEEDEEAKLNNQ